MRGKPILFILKVSGARTLICSSIIVFAPFHASSRGQLLVIFGFIVHTLDVLCNDIKHVPHVSRGAFSPASAKGAVTCHALQHVIAHPVTCVVLESFPAGINAPDYAVKSVLKATARHAPHRAKPG